MSESYINTLPMDIAGYLVKEFRDKVSVECTSQILDIANSRIIIQLDIIFNVNESCISFTTHTAIDYNSINNDLLNANSSYMFATVQDIDDFINKKVISIKLFKDYRCSDTARVFMKWIDNRIFIYYHVKDIPTFARLVVPITQTKYMLDKIRAVYVKLWNFANYYANKDPLNHNLIDIDGNLIVTDFDVALVDNGVIRKTLVFDINKTLNTAISLCCIPTYTLSELDAFMNDKVPLCVAIDNAIYLKWHDTALCIQLYNNALYIDCFPNLSSLYSQLRTAIN